MSVTLNVPVAMEDEVRYYANQRGISLSQFVFELVEKEARRIREERSRQAEECIAGLDALVRATHGRLDKPYVFSRADAYEQEVRYGLQYYDSLLLATAEVNGCEEFCSEDLNDGQTYCGIKAVNPFKVAQK